ncbi:MAG: hypothetical protein IBJ00_07970, partial [Alphaproteobacteria bacterium]|nr:hypothetical protein [Alphaproteobacteria bacterium]
MNLISFIIIKASSLLSSSFSTLFKCVKIQMYWVFYIMIGVLPCYASPQEIEADASMHKRARIVAETAFEVNDATPTTSQPAVKHVLDLKRGSIEAGLQIDLSNIIPVSYDLQGIISKHPSIEEVKLNDNAIEDMGAWFLSKALKKHTQVKTLKLKGNKIGNKGVKYIADNLPHLHNLILSFNKVDVEGVIYLMSFHHLSKLDLSYNPLGNEGIRQFARLLSSLIKLKELKLIDVKARSESLEMLIPAINKNTTLK